MEWVETTGRTMDAAKDLALDQLGVVADEAEFEILEEPRPGLFGRLRGEARVRARVRPASVRPKQDRRRPKRERAGATTGAAEDGTSGGGEDRGADDGRRSEEVRQPERATRGRPAEQSAARRPAAPRRVAPPAPAVQGAAMTDDRHPHDGPAPSTEDVQRAAEEFMRGLTTAFGVEAAMSSSVEEHEIEVRVDGDSLGLLIGPGGRTLLAIQDLARVSAQRRLGDHETRLRIDVAGYREKRRTALERFATVVAEQVRSTGVARALDPMPSADRKVIHDALSALDGVSSRSEGEEPDRRIVVAPG